MQVQVPALARTRVPDKAVALVAETAAGEAGTANVSVVASTNPKRMVFENSYSSRHWEDLESFCWSCVLYQIRAMSDTPLTESLLFVRLRPADDC